MALTGNARNSLKLQTQSLSAIATLLAICAGVCLAQSADKPASGGATQPAAQSSPAPEATGSAPTTLKVSVKVVNVLATVRDKHGKIVNDLGKDDFILNEDGHPQLIRYFASQTDLPLTLGLLVDTSLSQRKVLDEERSASHDFLDQMLREDKDKAFLIHFDREVELLQDLTSSRDKLETALGQLETPHFSQGDSGSDPDSDSAGRRRGGTMLYDAIFLASDELMKKQPGRKALIVLSDGVDHGSKETISNAIESAQRADTVVYSILFKSEQLSEHRGFGFPGGMGGPMGGGGRGGQRYPRTQEEHVDGKKILTRISTETGGRMFEASQKQNVASIYSQIEEELRHQYSLGYSSDQPSSSAGEYRKIVVTTKKKDLVVHAREGYYAGN
jgi:VWFA-related protein